MHEQHSKDTGKHEIVSYVAAVPLIGHLCGLTCEELKLAYKPHNFVGSVKPTELKGVALKCVLSIGKAVGHFESD